MSPVQLDVVAGFSCGENAAFDKGEGLGGAWPTMR